MQILKDQDGGGECIISYDVSALFTSIPVKSALEVTKKKLEQDKELYQRTPMSIQDILDLLEFCLYNTYFLFQGQYYEQKQGTAMGSSVSPVVANLYVEFFEDRALTTAVMLQQLIPDGGKGMWMTHLSY